MDTEDFIVARAALVEQLQSRRRQDWSGHPFRIMDRFGVSLPIWARLALSFMTQGGAMSRLLEMSLPLAIPFLFRKKVPFVERWVQRIFSHKS